MKLSRRQVQRSSRALPRLQFADQKLTSFSGLVLIQALFHRLHLRVRLERCFRHLPGEWAYSRAEIVMLLVLHVLLGYRPLRDVRYYEDDPMVCRLLGLRKLPGVSTLSRALSSLGLKAVDALQGLVRDLVLQRLASLRLRRVTLDFDGTVLGTSRWAEGTAIGYNPRRKGQRSYHPLLCMVAQTGQVLDLLHRPGNTHDSRGASAFIRACVGSVRSVLPRAQIEVRMDCAFFSHEIITQLHALKVDFTISVHFRGISSLKEKVERRRRWHRINAKQAYFDFWWKPRRRRWPRRFRVLVVRTRVRKPSCEPIQLDLFHPFVEGYECRALVTNKRLSARWLLAFHHGRGSQENLLGELKSQGQLDYVPTRTWAGNRTFLLATLLAHNLNRELQMTLRDPERTTTGKRTQLWAFQTLETLRRKLIQRAGRLTRPQGRLTLTLSANPAVQQELQSTLAALQPT